MIRSGCCILFSSFLRRRRPVSDGNSPTKVLCTLYMHTSTIKHRYNQCNHIKLNNCRRIFDNKTHQASYEVPRCSQWGQTLFEIVTQIFTLLQFYEIFLIFFHSVEEIYEFIRNSRQHISRSLWLHSSR